MNRTPMPHGSTGPVPENSANTPSPEVLDGENFVISATELVDVITSAGQDNLTVGVHRRIDDHISIGKCVAYNPRARGPAIELELNPGRIKVLPLGGNIVDFRPNRTNHTKPKILDNVPFPIFDEHIHKMPIIPFVEDHYGFHILPDENTPAERVAEIQEKITRLRLEAQTERT